jgi:N-methylhydantoinase B
VSQDFDPVLLSVMANAFDGVVREMMSGLLRSGRSSVLNTARDFSCALLTADGELLTAADGLPVHVFGAGLLSDSLHATQPVLRRGDAFLHNDPYDGGSHAADHSVLVPIFVDGRHLLTAIAKAHQADCGNALPSTYSPTARDVYEEGAVIFPCVRVQSDYEDVADVIRMCRSRIRVPDQWYGDYLATLGAARIGERRMVELIGRYGVADFERFVGAWFDYSERRMEAVLAKMPAGTLRGRTVHDPFPGTSENGLELQVAIAIDPAEGRVVLDLTDNPDNQPCGLNQTEATAGGATIAGFAGALPEQVPINAGAFRRIEVRLREGSVAGIPEFPHSCSCATTNIADRIVSMVQSALSDVDDGFGAAEGAGGQAPGKGVIAGTDERTGARFVNQLIIGGVGGGATPFVDGWPTHQRPSAGALIYHDSAEVDEMRYPILVHARELVRDSGGAGRRRGGNSTRVVLEPRFRPLTVSYALEGLVNPARGVRGGVDGMPPSAELEVDGRVSPLPPIANLELRPGERIVSVPGGGGGYGDPFERDPEAVLDDVREGRISAEAAEVEYGVVLIGDEVDLLATASRRDEFAEEPSPAHLPSSFQLSRKELL